MAKTTLSARGAEYWAASVPKAKFQLYSIWLSGRSLNRMALAEQFGLMIIYANDPTALAQQQSPTPAPLSGPLVSPEGRFFIQPSGSKRRPV
jgi:hypothetical protein